MSVDVKQNRSQGRRMRC